MIQEEVLQVVYFEDVLPKTGWGLYYKFMLGMACCSMFAQATALVSMQFAIPLASCEHYLTEEILYSLYGSLTAGRAIGGLLLSSLTGLFGRKQILCYNLIILFIGSFIAAFAYNFHVVILAMFFLGGAFESNGSVVKVHLAEVLPKNRRGYYLALCDCFWTAGYVCLALFSLIMSKPAYVDYRTVDMKVTTWRMIFAISGGLHLLLACCSALLEESPRYFLHIKKYFLAALTLKQFYAINTSSYGESFPVKELDLRHVVEDYGVAYYPDEQGTHYQLTKKMIVVLCKSLLLLTEKPFVRKMFVMIVIRTIVLILGVLEIHILLSKHINSNEGILSGIDVLFLETMRNGSFCATSSESDGLYMNFFILSGNILVGQILCMLTLDYIGRKICLASGLLLTGTGFLVHVFIGNGTAKIVLSSLILLAFSVVMTSLSVVSVELFPTAVRGTSYGVSNVLGLILSILVVRYFHMFEGYFFGYLGMLLIAVSVTAVLVDDLKKQPMVE